MNSKCIFTGTKSDDVGYLSRTIIINNDIPVRKRQQMRDHACLNRILALLSSLGFHSKIDTLPVQGL